MAPAGKKLVKEFYTSDFYKNPNSLSKYIHPEVELFWNSSAGFHKMHYGEIAEMLTEIAKSFHSLRAEVSHLLRDKDMVTIRFIYYVKTMENPEEELPMAHFIAIWELKDGKLFRGHQISQQADDSPENLGSFLSINL